MPKEFEISRKTSLEPWEALSRVSVRWSGYYSFDLANIERTVVPGDPLGAVGA